MSILTWDEVDQAASVAVYHMKGVGLLFGTRAQMRKVRQLQREVSFMRERLAYFQRLHSWQRSMDGAAGC